LKTWDNPNTSITRADKQKNIHYSYIITSQWNLKRNAVARLTVCGKVPLSLLPDKFQFDHAEKLARKGAFCTFKKAKIISRKPALNEASQTIDYS